MIKTRGLREWEARGLRAGKEGIVRTTRVKEAREGAGKKQAGSTRQHKSATRNRAGFVGSHSILASAAPSTPAW
jgi:hypothetical protein